MSVRASLELLLNKCGRTIFGARHRSGVVLHRIGTLPSGYSHLRDDMSQPFEVAVGDVTTGAGFSYHPEGWHPYLATLDELLEDPDSPYEGSVLQRYYQAFQPTSVGGVLLLGQPHVAPLDTWPASLELLIQLWAATPQTVAMARARQGTGQERTRRQEFGPHDESFGVRQRERILAIHTSITEHGFRPEAYRDGRLSGYFLVRGDDHRFLVTHGNHRLPTLRRLGIDPIPVRFDHEIPPVVNHAELDRWARPGGALTAASAEAAFTALFTSTGRERAALLGLV